MYQYSGTDGGVCMTDLLASATSLLATLPFLVPFFSLCIGTVFVNDFCSMKFEIS